MISKSSVKVAMFIAVGLLCSLISTKSWGICLEEKTRDQSKTFLTKFNNLKQPETFSETQWDLLIHSYEVFCHSSRLLYLFEQEYTYAGIHRGSIAKMWDYYAELKRTSVWLTDSVKKRKPIENTQAYFKKWVVYAHDMVTYYFRQEVFMSHYKAIEHHHAGSETAMKDLHLILD